MDSNADKKLDEFTEKLMKDFSLETPSFDFTTRVMSDVEALSNSKATEYTPLISKRIWALLSICVLAVLAYLFFGDVEVESAWLLSLQEDLTPNFGSLNLPDFQVSNVLLYSVVGFTFFISIQILLLKNHFSKRLA